MVGANFKGPTISSAYLAFSVDPGDGPSEVSILLFYYSGVSNVLFLITLLPPALTQVQLGQHLYLFC